MRVVVLPMDKGGCGVYRCIWPAATLRRVRPDWQVEIYRPDQVKLAMDNHDRLAAVQGLEIDGIDLVVTQRIGSPRTLQFLRLLRSRGASVILDADDALWAIHRDNSAYKAWNGSPLHWSWMDQAAKEADLVTVTTDRLARRYGRHGRVQVLPNRIPAKVCELAVSPADGLQIGWSGFVSTHPTDLQVVGGAVAQVLQENPAVGVTVVGDGQGILSAWQLREFRSRVRATGAADLEQYFANLTLLQIGLVPLEASLFNSCKSALKAAEYAAVGVPSVVTPTPANLALAKEGYPLQFASSPVEWYNQVSHLVGHPQEREHLAQGSLNAAVRHSLEEHIEDWARAWERAVHRRLAVAR